MEYEFIELPPMDNQGTQTGPFLRRRFTESSRRSAQPIFPVAEPAPEPPAAPVIEPAAPADADVPFTVAPSPAPRASIPVSTERLHLVRKVERPKFVPATVGVLERRTTAAAPQPEKRRSGWSWLLR